MQCTGVDHRQTELEFAHTLWSREGTECRGPLVSLRLQGVALREITAALDLFDATHVLARASKGNGSYEMCAAHWYDFSQVIGGAGEAQKNGIWRSLKISIFAMTSKGAGWDYKEMYNRFTSFYQAKNGKQLQGEP